MIHRAASMAGLVLVAVLSGLGSEAHAFWSAAASGTGSATTAMLGAPTNPVAVSPPGLGTVEVSWTDSVGGLAPQGHHVTRVDDTSGLTAPACGSSPTAPVTSPCTDTPLVAGSYRYTVTAFYESWTATGGPSNAVSVGTDVTGPTVTVSTVNGTAQAFPHRTAGPVSSIGGSCGTAPGDSATVAPLVDGTATSPATAACAAGSWSLVLDVPLTTDGTRLLSATQVDVAGNVGTAPAQSLIIDGTAPGVVSINRAGASQAVNAGPLAWTVTFSEPVSGVAAAQFSLVTSGITGTPTITSADAVGGSPSATWTVTVDVGAATGSNTGSVGLDLTDATGIADQAGNALGVASFAGQAYTYDTSAPTVLGIVRAGAAPVVNTGPLTWTVTFSEPVTGVAAAAFGFTASGVSGSPTITEVSASGGAPAETWTVTADVAGVTGTDTGSLGLDLTSAAGITDPAANSLVTTTFTGEAYAYDTTPPTVTGVSSTLADGSYTTGTVVPVTVTFSEPVTVTGSPQLALATGTPATTVVGDPSGSGSATLTFGYTVAAGHTSADLDYASAAALALDGGAITDVASNAANLTLPAPGAAGSLAAAKDLVIDTTAPVVSVTQVNGAAVDFPFGTRRNVTSIGGTCGTAVGDSTTVTPLVDGAATAPATATCTGGAWTLTFTRRLSTVGTYVLTASQTDLAGNLGAAPEQTLVIDKTRPTLVSIVRAGPSPAVSAGPLVWTVTFSEPVIGVAASNFTLATSGITGTPTITGLTAPGGSSGDTWTVTADVAGVTGSDAGSIGLDLDNGTGITDLGANVLSTRSFTGEAYAFDSTVPSVTGVSSTLADGSYPAGTVVPVTVTFDEAVTVAGVPQLALVTGDAQTTAVGYTSGSGTTELTFSYTVQAGDASADLDYEGVAALTLDGGAITDAAANPAALALPAPGAAGSLADSSDLVIDTVAPTVVVSGMEVFPRPARSSVRATGTAEPGAGRVTVHLCFNVGPTCDETNATQTLTKAVSDIDGTWTTRWSADNGQGTWYVSATQTDEAGNTGTSAVFGPFVN